LLISVRPIDILLQTLGSTVFVTAAISIILDRYWSRARTAIEQGESTSYMAAFRQFTDKLQKLDVRLKTCYDIGLNACYSDREEALEKFYEYAEALVPKKPEEAHLAKKASDSDEPVIQDNIIKIVSSSARGIIGYTDRKNHKVQDKWRELIVNNKEHFQILLTHPSFAYLRQPSEERASGDIEIEIIKTALFLRINARMDHENVRMYRGSPTVFLIRAGKYALVNPYPYGQMAMNTLCLHFEIYNEHTMASKFCWMHFDHPWAFEQQKSKMIDNKEMVVGVNSLVDILEAFSECKYIGSRLLRLTKPQIAELDLFTYTMFSKRISDLRKINPSEVSDEAMHMEIVDELRQRARVEEQYPFFKNFQMKDIRRVFTWFKEGRGLEACPANGRHLLEKKPPQNKQQSAGGQTPPPGGATNQ
jgi:hypothetical protein